jgi:DNA invertase Pin-like site-specific DNA recombinase
MPDATPTKVRTTHLQRDAFLYVRQSTLQQLVHNTESTQRQYALRQRAIALGWPSEQVHVIDCDLGQSGASAADRAGFQQLVTEVSLGHAGIVLGLEVSRLARNSTDWHRLLELCALADTLILDEDGLYDCNDFNDRLLLGLKGTLSEAELHFLRARLRGGLLNKARRGELAGPLPVGLVYDDQARVQLDPDTQVQEALRLLFATFRRTGTARATVKYFREHDLQFPRRLKTGPRKGELVWGVLGHARTLQVLHNPRYAGAFFFGRTRTRLGPHGAVQYLQKDRNDWVALIPDAHPGYIPWDEYEDNQRRLLECAQAHGHDRRKSPPGEGPALLQGLAMCGVCGRRMSVRYHERKGRLDPDYTCLRTRIDLAEPGCQVIPGQTIDRAIAQLALATMTPVSVETALAVQHELLDRQQEADRLRAKQVERAQYEADLARQRYMRCDPNNRLVASTLEADWNTALRALEQAQTECEQQRQQETLAMTDEVRSRVRALTTDFPAVWRDPRTTDRDRKRMLRLLIEDVTLLKTTQAITLQVRFRGGSTKTLTLPALQNSWQAWTTRPEIITEIDRLLDDSTDRHIAEVLNQRGWRSGKGEPFNTTIIARLRKVYGLTDRYTRLRACGLLTVEEIATKLGVCTKTVKQWRDAGLLTAHAYTDKPECLYELPTGDTIPTKQQGRKLSTRPRPNQVIPNPFIEVQHES